ACATISTARPEIGTGAAAARAYGALAGGLAAPVAAPAIGAGRAPGVARVEGCAASALVAPEPAATVGTVAGRTSPDPSAAARGRAPAWLPGRRATARPAPRYRPVSSQGRSAPSAWRPEPWRHRHRPAWLRSAPPHRPGAPLPLRSRPCRAEAGPRQICRRAA